MRGRLLLVLAAIGAGCGPGGTGVVADLRNPVAVVSFFGMSPANPGAIVPLLAVAANHGDELRIIDPQADLAVRAPAVYGPLAVPTLPAPSVLGSASLGDGQADVLLVANGGTVVQLFATWIDGVNPQVYGIISAWDLAPVVAPAGTAASGAGSQILCMAGVPLPGAEPSGNPPVWPVVPGVGRVIVGFSGGSDGLGGKLVVLDFARNPDGSVFLSDAPTVKVLGFDPLAIAPSPDRVHVYVATKDTIVDSSGNQALGVAEVDVRAQSAASWTVRAFNGRGPTVSVAAAILGERTAASSQDFGPPQLRVYAALDPAGCGPTQPIACGVATFDPATGGLAADPAPPPSPIGAPVPQQPYRAPLYVPYTGATTYSNGSGGMTAFPLVVAAGPPAASGSSQCSSPANCPIGVNDQGIPQPLGELQSQVWTQWTTGVAAVGAGDGNVYVEDLGRFGPPDEILLLDNSLSRTQVLLAVSTPAPTALSGPFLGLYDPPGLGAAPEAGATIVIDSGDLLNSIVVWPGFTPNDTFTLTSQGILPGLGGVSAVLGRLAAGGVYLAVQQSANPVLAPASSAGWLVGANVGAPDLAIHAADTWPEGDIAQFYADEDTSGCVAAPAPGQPSPLYEATVASILAPDPVNYPGGALLLAVVPGSVADCLAQRLLPTSASAPLPVHANVRASGLVLVSTSLGYAGRPQLGERYNLAWQPEDGLSGEALVLARKARRLFYPGGPYLGSSYLGNPCPGGTACYPGFPEMTDPMQPGPVVGFRPAVYCSSGPCPAGTLPPRDAYLNFQTASGMTALSSRPANVATPTSALYFDKSVFADSTSQALGWSFYVTYTGDVLFVETPTAYGSVRTIR